MPQQARRQQRRQRGQHPAHADRRATLETRLAPVQQAQAGRHAACRVVRRAAQHGGRAAPVALFLAGQLCAGAGCRLAPAARRDLAARQQPLLGVAPQRRARDAQGAGHAVDAAAFLEHRGGAGQQVRVVNAMPTSPLAGLGEAGLAFLLQPLAGAAHRLGADAEGACQLGLGSQPVQREAAEAAIAARLVVGGMRLDRVGAVEVDHAVAVQQHAEAGTDGDRLAGLQAEGGGQAGGLGARCRAVHLFHII